MKYYIAIGYNDGFDSFIEDREFVQTHGTPVVRGISLNTEDPKFFSSRAAAEKVLRKIRRISPGLDASIVQEESRRDPPARNDYAEAKRLDKAAENETRAASKFLERFPTLENGMTPDIVKFSPEFREAKARFDAAFARSRSINKWFYKTFKKEILAERKAHGR